MPSGESYEMSKLTGSRRKPRSIADEDAEEDEHIWE
jgi:hypothetical protein